MVFPASTAPTEECSAIHTVMLGPPLNEGRAAGHLSIPKCSRPEAFHVSYLYRPTGPPTRRGSAAGSLQIRSTCLPPGARTLMSDCRLVDGRSDALPAGSIHGLISRRTLDCHVSSDHVVSSKMMTPLDFRDRLLSVKGAAFGIEPVITPTGVGSGPTTERRGYRKLCLWSGREPCVRRVFPVSSPPAKILDKVVAPCQRCRLKISISRSGSRREIMRGAYPPRVSKCFWRGRCCRAPTASDAARSIASAARDTWHRFASADPAQGTFFSRIRARLERHLSWSRYRAIMLATAPLSAVVEHTPCALHCRRP